MADRPGNAAGPQARPHHDGGVVSTRHGGAGPVVVDLGVFYDRWKKSAAKIAARMQENVELTLSLITGGGGGGGSRGRGGS